MRSRIVLLALALATLLVAIPLLRRETAAPQQEILRSVSDVASRPASPLEIQLLAAESTYWRGEYDSARVAWTDLLSTPALSADSAAVAEVQTWLCLTSWRLGEYKAAREHGELALALKQRLGVEAALPRTYNALGLLAWNEGRLTDASRLFETGLEIADRVNDVASAIKFANNIGLVETEFARFDRARAGFTRSRTMAGEAGETRLEGNALTNLAMLDVRVGDAAAAIPKLNEALRLYAEVEYQTGVQNALGQLSTAYALLGDLRRAFATLDSATQLAASQDLKQDVASNLEIMADLYRDAGDLRKALHYYERAQALNRELGLELERGAVLRRMAQVHAALGAGAAAVSAAKEAARIHESAGARADELKDRLFLAEHGPDGPKELQRARELVAVVNTPVARAEVALVGALLAHERGDHAAVLAVLLADSANLAKAGFDTESRGAVLRAVALAGSGDTKRAAAATAAALESLERARATLPSGMLRASFAAQRVDLYEMLVATQLELGLTVQAFATSEHARARAPGTADRSSGAVAALQRVRALTDTVNALDGAVANGNADERVHRDELARALSEARSEYASLLARADWRTTHSPVPELNQLQRVLQPGEVFLQYFVGRNDVYAFAVTRSGMRVQKLAIGAPALLAKARLARTAMQERRAGSSPVLASLYDQLVRPFGIRAQRIIVAPHAALAYVPFAALQDGTTGRYLIENSTIAYVSGAGQLIQLRRMDRIDEAPSALVFQPFPEQLPGSRAEARAVQRAWRGAKVKRGEAASVSALRIALADERIVHVSSHGAMDPFAPLFSFVSLAGGKDSNARFEIHDVFATRVRAPLVFLSGCETGLGTASNTGYETGDDASTFAHAFLASGTRAVVSTVWRIEDRSAALLAERFYQHLRTEDAAMALATAQRALLRSADYRAPFYWAPYMVTGEVSFVRERQRI